MPVHRRDLDATQVIRLTMMEMGDKSRCLGCGDKAPQDGYTGTSRWNSKAGLCTSCCEREALGSQADPFGLANLPGGKNYAKEA